MKRKGQFALEFIVLVSFMLLIFLGLFAVLSSRILEAKDWENKQIAEELANTVVDEVMLANSVADGYSRNFEVPRKFKGNSYTIEIIGDRELVVNYSGQEHVSFLPSNVIGNVNSGLNKIEKIDGIIYLKSIAECADDIDNDDDGEIDFPDDSGCDDSSDNDESNCGDGVCEGYESCLSCSSDCGACFVPGKLIFKSGGSNIASFDRFGNLVLHGGLLSEAQVNPADGIDEFIFKNSLGDPVAMISPDGVMRIAGVVSQNEENLNPAGGTNFVIKDFNGIVVSYIDDSGNLFLKGTLTENGDP